VSEPLYAESFQIRGGDFEHGGEVATRIKAICKQLGIRPDLIRRLSIANFEAEMNVIMYAGEADLSFQVLAEEVRVVVADRGPGISNIDLAMTPGFSTATPEMRARGFGAGLGLPNIRNSVDEFRVESNPGTGTTLTYAVRLA
jgi:anti-sigma regulatory factor (Ser/Thr protein kinase)